MQIVACLAVACAGMAAAQGTRFLAGDKVEYKAQNYPEKWLVGTFVRELPGGKQVLIREVPTEFFPEGFERAYALNEVRAPRAGSPPPPATSPKAPAATPAMPPMPPMPGAS